MTFLLLSVLFNTSLIVIFRYFGRLGIRNDAAIVINYFVCFIIGLMVSKGDLLRAGSFDPSWTWKVILIGSLFVITFNIVAACVQNFGITITALLQKMSVVLVVVYSVYTYDESIDIRRLSGLIFGVVAILMITGMKRSKSRKAAFRSLAILLPMVVFVNSALIDIMFLHVNRLGISLDREAYFGSWIFLAAAILGLIAYFIGFLGGKRLSHRDVIAGVVLGVPNFFSVYFIQKMLTSSLDGSAIFPIHNISILLLSALVSLILFKEIFRLAKFAGIGFAILSIILLAS